MCLSLNEILIKEKLFLRVYELKDKFRFIIHQTKKKETLLEKF